MFLKTLKFGMQQKARIFHGLPNLNLFHIMTQDSESNSLKQKIETEFFGQKTLFLTKKNDFEILF